MARDYIIVMRKQPYDYACTLLKERNEVLQQARTDEENNIKGSSHGQIQKIDDELLMLSKVMAAFADG